MVSNSKSNLVFPCTHQVPKADWRSVFVGQHLADSTAMLSLDGVVPYLAEVDLIYRLPVNLFSNPQSKVCLHCPTHLG